MGNATAIVSPLISPSYTCVRTFTSISEPGGALSDTVYLNSAPQFKVSINAYDKDHLPTSS